MRIYADRIQVERGEDWTYDVYFQNRDRSPYIVSSKLQNAQILVTVASSKYTQNGRYIANFWNEVAQGHPTFYSTEPTVIVDTSATSISNLKSPKNAGVTLPAGQDYDTFSVYAWTDNDGETHYLHWIGTADLGVYEEYSFHFVQQFPTEITNEWIEQSYVFGIKLVGGIENPDYDPNNLESRPLLTAEGVQVLVAPMQLIVTSNIAGSIL